MKAVFAIAAIMLTAWYPAAHAQGADELQVGVKVLYMAIPKQVAAEWGLDGGPPTNPDKTPLARPIGSTLVAADAQKLIAAMRETAGCSMIACASATAKNGGTTVVSDVQTVTLPVGVTDDGKPMFDDGRDLGITLAFSPVLELETGRIKVEMRPELTRLVGFAEFGQARMPVISRCSAEMSFTVKPGSTRVVTVSPPSQSAELVSSRQQVKKADADEMVTVLLVTVEMITE
jgi:hypothetical protein